MTILEQARHIARKTLEQGKAQGVLGLREAEGGVSPHLFEDPGDIDSLVVEPKWLLAKLATGILKDLPDDYRLAVMCRGCDERAIVELIKRNQIDREKIHVIGLACSQDQARACLCTRPYPSEVAAGDVVEGVDPFQDERARSFLEGDQRERMIRWATELRRCVKCYGCRNSCPICVCVPCKLENDLWVGRGEIPADMISFHLIRAFHLSDTCVACGACQDACPENIPLMLLQISMRASLMEKYGYEAGTDRERRSPVLSDLTKEPSPGCEVPGWIDSLKDSA